MTDRDLLEIIAAQVGKLTVDVDDIKATLPTLITKQELAELKSTLATKQELAEVKAIVVKIENDHGQKLGALLDGYKQNSEKLDRIEAEVSKHEEIIKRRIG